MAATDPPPSRSGLRGLDAVNLFLAGALSGFGPYVAVFLADQRWPQQDIGFVLTAGGLAGLPSLPGGELLDVVRSKRVVVASAAVMVAAGALIIALWPSFPLVLAALVSRRSPAALGLAIASISLGLVGHAALGERLGRNQRFASMGGVIAAGFMGVIGYFFSYRAIFFAAAALVLPLLAALGRIRLSGIHYGRVSSSLGRRAREHGALAFGRTATCLRSPVASFCFSWAMRRCCHLPERRWCTARKPFLRSSSQR